VWSSKLYNILLIYKENDAEVFAGCQEKRDGYALLIFVTVYF
jgi:hypothetical protein